MIYCKICDYHNQNDMNFCQNCGEKFSEEQKINEKKTNQSPINLKKYFIKIFLNLYKNILKILNLKIIIFITIFILISIIGFHYKKIYNKLYFNKIEIKNEYIGIKKVPETITYYKNNLQVNLVNSSQVLKTHLIGYRNTQDNIIYNGYQRFLGSGSIDISTKYQNQLEKNFNVIKIDQKNNSTDIFFSDKISGINLYKTNIFNTLNATVSSKTIFSTITKNLRTIPKETKNMLNIFHLNSLVENLHWFLFPAAEDFYDDTSLIGYKIDYLGKSENYSQFSLQIYIYSDNINTYTEINKDDINTMIYNLKESNPIFFNNIKVDKNIKANSLHINIEFHTILEEFIDLSLLNHGILPIYGKEIIIKNNKNLIKIDNNIYMQDKGKEDEYLTTRGTKNQICSELNSFGLQKLYTYNILQKKGEYGIVEREMRNCQFGNEVSLNKSYYIINFDSNETSLKQVDSIDKYLKQ